MSLSGLFLVTLLLLIGPIAFQPPFFLRLFLRGQQARPLPGGKLPASMTEWQKLIDNWNADRVRMAEFIDLAKRYTDF